MCGILACFNTNHQPEAFKDALMLMKHRGPDAQKMLALDGHLMGHLRLSIIDLNTRSDQPYVSGDYVMIYNGEVYNYKELIKEHRLRMSTASDTEVVLKMYEKYGEDCLKYFNGMFAIAIYNTRTKDIFVARDRLGIKPIYYRKNGASFEFSSEVSALLSLKDSKFDEFGIRQYRKLRMTIKGHTYYEDIKFFPPGHYFKNGTFHKYWELDVSKKAPPKDDELKYLITDAVLLRKRSDVSVGSYLSGGLDSTILSYLLNPTHTWTVGFPDMNEFKWGKLANVNLISEHHQIVVEKETFIAIAEEMIKIRREPLSVPNEVLIHLMTKEVTKKNTVVLSGEGADELFWGYDRIFKWANSIDSIQLNEFDNKYCYGSNQDDEVIDFALESIPGKTPLDKIGYYFQIHHLQGLLRRLDNSTMLNSVEARVPFVDHRLVEMMAGTPFEWRMGNSFKEPLKRLFSDLIPQEVINRKKIGFPVPLEAIFKEKTDDKTTPMDAWLLFNLKHLNQ